MKRIGPPRNSWGAQSDLVSLTRVEIPTRNVEFQAKPQNLQIDLSSCALMIIDMQNDFCSPRGWLASIGVSVDEPNSIIESVGQVADALRNNDVPIIWLNWGNRPDRSNLPPGVVHVYNPDGNSVGIGDELPGTNSKVLEKGSWSSAIVDLLKPASSDLFVDKYRMSGFFDTPLDSILRNLAVKTILFAGVNVDQCVLATLMDAASLGYDVILLEDCCATTSPRYCVEATHYNVAQCFGFVANSKHLIKSL